VAVQEHAELNDASPGGNPRPDFRHGQPSPSDKILADRFQTDEVLTLDQRHYRAVTPLTGRFPAYRLVPLDGTA
jgi:hypothetical protein